MDPITMNDIITLKNITSKDFTFYFNRSRGGAAYVIPAGQTKMFPRFIATLGVKHLIDKILNDAHEKTNNLLQRIELASQIIVGEETYRAAAELTEEEKLNQRVDQLNKPTDLDMVLAKRKVKLGETSPVLPEAPSEPAVPGPATQVNLDEKFAGLKTQAKIIDKAEKQKEVAEKEAAKALTKADLIAYAEGSLKLVIDDKTKEAFDALSVEELAAELQYPGFEKPAKKAPQVAVEAAPVDPQSPTADQPETPATVDQSDAGAGSEN